MTQKVKLLGTFLVREIKGETVIFDPFLKGGEATYDEYEEEGCHEFKPDGSKKAFDGFQVGDFFRFGGLYDIKEAHDLFTKIEQDKMTLSFPNHKVLEV